MVCRHGSIELVKYLVEELHCDPRIPNKEGELPLHAAVSNSKDPLEKVRLVSNCDVNARTVRGETALHIACEYQSIEIVKCLVEELHCDSSIANKEGELPLHIAISNRKVSLEKVRVVSSCDVDARTVKEETALHIACGHQSIEFVKYLVEELHCDPYIPNKDGKLPLHIAIASMYNSLEKVKVLFKNCDVNAKTTMRGETTLHIACRHGSVEIVKYLVEELNCDPCIPNKEGELPIHIACKRLKSRSLAMVMLVSSWDVNARTVDGESALHIACREGNMQLIKYFFEEKHCDTNVRNDKGEQPLHVACRSRNAKVVEYLVHKMQCDPCIPNNNGELPLHIACQGYSLKVVQLVGECNINSKTLSGETALQLACRVTVVNFEIVTFLVEKGCDPGEYNFNAAITAIDVALKKNRLDLVKIMTGSNFHFKDMYGNTLLHFACRNSAVAFAEDLIEQKHLDCNPDVRNNAGELPLHSACRERSLEMVKLVSSCCDVNTQTASGNTAVHIACMEKSVVIVRWLIADKHCRVNIPNELGKLPLHIACECNLLPLVELVSGCDVNMRTKKEEDTPLHIACKRRQVLGVVQFLMQKGCNPDIQNIHGELPLHIACRGDSLEIVKLVSNCCVNTSKADGETALHVACRTENANIVKYLMEEKQCNPTILSLDGVLPLHIACNSQSLEIVKMVSNCDANTQTATRETALHMACRHGNADIVQFLIDKNYDPSLPNGVGELSLHIACRYCSVEIVKLVSDCDVNAKTENGETALHAACKQGSVEVVKYLIDKKGCIVSVQDVAGELPFHIACRAQSLQIARLVDSCDVNTRMNSGDTALHIACSGANADLVKYLIEVKHCDPFIKNVDLELPLHIACRGLSLDIVQLVSGCDINSKTRLGDTPLHIACRNSSKQIIQYLVEEKKCDQTVQNIAGDLPFHVACTRESLELVILVSNCDAGVKNMKGETALHVACKKGNVEMVEYLIKEKQCDPALYNNKRENPASIVISNGNLNLVEALTAQSADYQDIEGNTLLHMACQQGKVFAVRYLTRVKACNPLQFNNNGETPLDIACQSGSAELTAAVLESSVNWKDEDEDGNNALHILCKHTKTEVVKHLVGKHYDPAIPNSNGELPLHIACSKKSLSLVKLVSGCDVNARTASGETPLHIACREGTVAMVKYLTQVKNCNLNIQNDDGELPLHIASRKQNFEMVKLVSDCNVKCQNNQGNIPLHEACRRKSKDIVEYLAKCKNSEPDYQNHDGQTPLHYACQAGATEIVKYLVCTAKANPKLVDSKGQTPLTFAWEPQIIKLLVDHGADPSSLYKVYRDFFQSHSSEKPPASPLKILVVGNTLAGKTTLIESLKCEGGEDPKVPAPHTAGIIPTDYESGVYGCVTWYDFAGQPEYYASHEAVMHHVIALSPPVILLLVNINEQESEVEQKLFYWLAFIENQCHITSSSSKPHLIIVGSHADMVKSTGTDPEEKLSFIAESLQSRFQQSAVELTAAVSLDCREPQSLEINKLRQKLTISSDLLRNVTVMNFTCHCFYVFLLDKFCSHPAITVSEIIRHMEDDYFTSDDEFDSYSTESDDEEEYQARENDPLELLPTSPTELVTLCEELNKRGHIMLLKDPLATPEESWVVFNKEALLADVNGTIFAPKHFKKHKSLASSTGVVPLSKLATRFPQYPLGIVLGFLTHLEFCQEICDQEVLHLITGKEEPMDISEKYYFFPSLVSIEKPQSVWKTDQCCGYQCGWILQCSESDQFFTPRFLQVLLLRLAFSFALLPSKRSELPIIRRVCSVWKSGISWVNRYGVETVVEVGEQSQMVIVLMRCIKDARSEMKCIRLRSEIIKKVMNTKKDFCPNVYTAESFIAPWNLQYPPLPSTDMSLFSIVNISATVAEGAPVIVNDENSYVKLEELLYFEPYADLGERIIGDIFQEQNSCKEVGSDFLSRMADQVHHKKDMFIELFHPSATFLQEKVSRAPHPGSTQEFIRVFHAWKDYITYQCLREEFNKYSIFCGRNPLKLTLDAAHESTTN